MVIPHRINFDEINLPLEWWHRLALSLIKCGGNNTSVLEIHLSVRSLLPAQGVLHPVLVVSVWEILTGVGTTRLLASGGRDGSLSSAGQQIPQLQGLN